jgi:hypothetical protein
MLPGTHDCPGEHPRANLVISSLVSAPNQNGVPGAPVGFADGSIIWKFVFAIWVQCNANNSAWEAFKQSCMDPTQPFVSFPKLTTSDCYCVGFISMDNNQSL